MSKNKVVRRIDQPISSNAGFATVETLDSPAPPALPTIPAPTDLTLTTALARSAVTPTALIAATWIGPLFVQPHRYAVQWSADSSFPDGTTGGVDVVGESVTIDGLKPATLYYVRVAAVYSQVQSPWSDTMSITTENDTTPPDPVSAAAGDFSTGDLVLSWTNPSSANLKDVRVRIYTSNGGTLLREVSSVTGRFVWTAQMNLLDTGGFPDPSLYVVLTARTWTNVLSTDVTLSVTKAAPVLTGSVTTNWDGDAGTAPADLVLSWSTVANVKDYVVTLDGVDHITSYNRFTYSLATNRQEHSGTADPTIAYVVKARDTLLQGSNTLSGTVTNAAPDAASLSLSGSVYFSTLNANITHPTPLQDLDYYTYKLYQNNALIASFRTGSASPVLSLNGSGLYKFGVIATDLFGRSSSEVLTSNTSVDSLTIAELRSEGDYSDSIATDFSGANKDVLRDDVTSAATGIQYTSGAWRWTQYVRPIAKLIRRVSIAIDQGATTFYLGTSVDGSSWRWFAGATTVNGVPTLTEYASETLAQTNATACSVITSGYVELPTEINARYVKLGHKHASTSYYLSEFYPRSWIQADDIRAGSIVALHIAAASITADRLSVSQLSAITADLGSITAGTITGATIQTSASGARTVLSSAANGGIIGYGASDTYNPSTGSGTYQLLWKKSDGKLYAGGGNVVLDGNGIAITAPIAGGFSYDPKRAISWSTASGTTAVIQAFSTAPISGTTNGIEFHAYGSGAVQGKVNIVADGSGYTSALYLNGTAANGDVHTQGYFGVNTTPSYPLHVLGDGFISGNIYWGTGGNWLSAYLNQALLTTSSPTFLEHYANGWFRSNTSGVGWYHQVHGGGIYMDDATMVKVYNNVGFAAMGNSGFGLLTQPSTARLVARGANTSSSNQALLVQNSTPSNLMLIRNDGGAGSAQVIVAWTVTSDRAVKRNIKDTTKGLAELKRLRPRTYDRPLGDKKDEHGFVAQELQEVFPEMVNATEDGTLGIAYTELIPVLVRAVQELSDQLADLKKPTK
jgi:hypothetical protein